MEKYLKILDEIEDVRQRAAEHPENYPVDFVIRVCAAIVAKENGIKDRTEWTGKLRENPGSKYCKKIHAGNFHI